MSNPAQPLIDLKREHGFLIGIDSDGCAFDTMEIKQKECFIPATIKVWGLQAISKYARESHEFVNLYSRWRGANRFPALIKTFEFAAERKEVKQRGFKMPDLGPLKEWVAREKKLGNPALEALVKTDDNPVLKQALQWTTEVNERVADMVYGIPPFPYVRESLDKMNNFADVIVVSQTPSEALVREWEEHGIDKKVKVIAGQEMGTKTDHLRLAKADHYADDKVLMIGDALGDYKAAQENNVLFYPINPGHEEDSWQRFYEEALDRFAAGTYAGSYQGALVTEFKKYLPEIPPWNR